MPFSELLFSTGLLCLVAASIAADPTLSPPNIVFIIADDLGHADLGYSEGSHQTPTPNIDALAWDGIILNRHYTHSMCSPSRGALLTGKYAFQTGFNVPTNPGEPSGIPLNIKLLPQYLKDRQYNTFMLGKWHVGSHTREYFPGSRGFDYWLGYMEAEIGALDYSTGWLSPTANRSGRNLYENGAQIATDCLNDKYLPHLLTEKFEQIIADVNASQPFYIQFASPLPKAGSESRGGTRFNRQFTMPEYDRRPAVSALDDKFRSRKQQLAQIQALDDQVKRIHSALERRDLLNNTIIVFISDNGAAPWPSFQHANHGSNWPLRMFRGTSFEGGVRNLAFMWSPLLKRRGIATDQLFHIVDWLPTLHDAAGGNVADLGEIAGVSQWDSLREGEQKGPRSELVVNLHNFNSNFAGKHHGMIYQDPGTGVLYKILGGKIFNSSYTGWVRTEGTNSSNYMTTPTPVSINCGMPEPIEKTVCRPWIADCLFDLTSDPCETNNIAASNPAMLQLLRDKLTVYNATHVPCLARSYDPKSNPQLWQGWWVPWLDPNPVMGMTSCPFNQSSLVA